MPAEKDLESLKKSLKAKIMNEITNIEESIDCSKAIKNKLTQYSNATLEKIRLKISVLNKGNTDALIRSLGEISFFKNKITVPIYQEDPPSKDNIMAVAVAIVGESPKPVGGISVGKIEQHTLKQFWYCIDYEKANDQSKKLINELIKGSMKYRVLLKDQDNNAINSKFLGINVL